MKQPSLTVMKFGGSSVGTPLRFKQIARIVEQGLSRTRVLVVASALSDVTRMLDKAAHQAAEGYSSRLMKDLYQRHRQHAEAVLEPGGFDRYQPMLEERVESLESMLIEIAEEGISLARRDFVLAIGEQLSVPLVALSLNEAGLAADPVDATEFIITDDQHGEANVKLEKTRSAVRRWDRKWPSNVTPVVAGFIGATESGQTTTLGFEGSDYSAALLASMLGAGELVRWTDVDGIYTADPRTHEDARRLRRISMEEAARRNAAGKLGMHPQALRPLLRSRTSVVVRCIDTPEDTGTVIEHSQQAGSSNEPAFFDNDLSA